MNLVKNYAYNLFYQIFILIVPLITVPYVSRILGSNGIGVYAYTSSIVSYFILFGSIGINLYGNRTIAYVKKNAEELSNKFWEIVFLRILCIAFSLVFFFVFIIMVDRYRTYYLYQSILIIAAGLDISWFFMGMEDFKKTVLRNTLVKVISLAAIFTFVKDEKDLGIYILILSISMLLGNITLWPYIFKMIDKPKLSKINIKQHLLPSLSLFVPQIATQIYLVLNKTMLGYMTNVSNSGYYENTDKLVKMVLAIVTATGTVMLPRMATTFSEGNHDKVKKYLLLSFEFVTAISIPLALGLAAVAPKFSIWFFGNDFAITGELIPILSLIIIFIGWSNVLGTQYLLPTNQTKYFTISVVSGALLNLILNISLIKLFGVIGAVWATVFSELFVTFIQIYFVKSTIPVSELYKSFWKYAISGIVMFFIVRKVSEILEFNILSLSFQIIVGSTIYLFLLFILKAPILFMIFKKLKFESRS